MADDPRVLELVDQFVRQQAIINKVKNMLDDPARVDRAEQVAHNLDKKTQSRLDKLCEDLTGLMKVPVAAVTLINTDQQLVLGACGISHEPMERDHSFCIFVAASGTAFQMDDVPQDDLPDLPLYSERGIRAYLGQPLVVRNQTVGALCAVDFVPREWTELENMLLTNYAAHASGILEERT